MFRLLLFLCVWLCACNRTPPKVQATYVEPATCRPCHAAIWDTYQRTGMARAFYKPTTANVIEDYTKNNRFYHEPSNRYYEMIQRDGRFLQRRYEVDVTGKQRHVYEREAHFVIGSGNHARTYLHRSESGELVELPVSWYPGEKRWAMSPGYDRPDHPDFRRRVDYGCLFCHNAYPKLEAGADRFGREAHFPSQLPEGIDCQRCHGPGSIHVERKGDKASIVNPARLSPKLQMDVCMQCHLETTSSALPASTRVFGRDVFSYRAGEPLGNYMVYFDHPAHAPQANKFEIAGGGYRFRKSACFVKSQGKLTCTTCHNPHDVPRGAAAEQHYSKVCRSCHATTHSEKASKVDASKGCTGCHMPKRRPDDAVHVVMTDHWIQRQRPPGDLLAARLEKSDAYRGPVVFYDPPPSDGDLYLGIAHAAEGADRKAGITLLEKAAKSPHVKAKVILADALQLEGKKDAAIPLYEAALKADPSLGKVRLNYAQLLEPSLALAELEKLNSPEAHYERGNVLLKLGQPDLAIQAFRAAVALRPDYAEAHTNLGALLADHDHLDEAMRELEIALNIDPNLADAHNNFARILAPRGLASEAIGHLRRALAVQPNHPESRLNLGRLLQQMGRSDEAAAEFRRVIAVRPDMSDAHLSLGIALGEQGDMEGAVASFKQALRLGNPEAARNLQIATESNKTESKK